MTEHECSGLRTCMNHPKWRLWKGSLFPEWWVNAPGTPTRPGFVSRKTTWDDALKMMFKEMKEEA